jgi:hypothetical protein
MELWIVLAVVVVFNIAASQWGVDSRDGIDSPEWERRARRGHAL